MFNSLCKLGKEILGQSVLPYFKSLLFHWIEFNETFHYQEVHLYLYLEIDPSIDAHTTVWWSAFSAVTLHFNLRIINCQTVSFAKELWMYEACVKKINKALKSNIIPNFCLLRYKFSPMNCHCLGNSSGGKIIFEILFPYWWNLNAALNRCAVQIANNSLQNDVVATWENWKWSTFIIKHQWYSYHKIWGTLSH